MDLKSAVTSAAGLLEGASVEEDGGVFYVSVPTGDEDDEEPRPVTVAIYAGEDGETLIARSEIGPYLEEIDLAEVLRWIDSAIFARVYIASGEDEEEGSESLVIEAGGLLRLIDGGLLAQMVQEVADLADEIGAALFDGSEATDA